MTAHITKHDSIDVSLEQHVGDDQMIARAARVSTGNDQIPGLEIEGLIRYLARAGHTSPFEHTSITVRVEAPIFVAREAFRHRVFSFNEISGRYAALPQRFYVPPHFRPLVNAGSGARPDLVDHTDEQYRIMTDSHDRVYRVAAIEYDRQRDAGIANEVARNVLPVGLYTAWYQTGNLHAWLHFLGLRQAPNAQWEIRQMANQVAVILEDLFPLAMKYWPRIDVD